MTVPEAEHPAIDVLRVLAISRSSGSLEVRGLTGGAFFLQEGEITYAETIGVPPVLETSEADPDLSAMIRSTIFEAGVEMLSASRAHGDRPLFRPGRCHWTGRRCRVAVEHLLAEITELTGHFAQRGVSPDAGVSLCWLPRGHTVVVDAQQWGLIGRLTGTQSPRALARHSGIPLTATLASIASLISAGVAEPVPAEPAETDGRGPARLPAERTDPRPPAPDTGPLETPDRPVTASSILTASKPITTPPAPERLPRRRPRTIGADPAGPGSTSAGPGPTDGSRRPPVPEDVEGLDPAGRVSIALRVLAGLKRL